MVTRQGMGHDTLIHDALQLVVAMRDVLPPS